MKRPTILPVTSAPRVAPTPAPRLLITSKTSTKKLKTIVKKSDFLFTSNETKIVVDHPSVTPEILGYVYGKQDFDYYENKILPLSQTDRSKFKMVEQLTPTEGCIQILQHIDTPDWVLLDALNRYQGEAAVYVLKRRELSERVLIILCKVCDTLELALLLYQHYDFYDGLLRVLYENHDTRFINRFVMSKLSLRSPVDLEKSNLVEFYVRERLTPEALWDGVEYQNENENWVKVLEFYVHKKHPEVDVSLLPVSMLKKYAMSMAGLIVGETQHM